MHISARTRPQNARLRPTAESARGAASLAPSYASRHETTEVTARRTGKPIERGLVSRLTGAPASVCTRLDLSASIAARGSMSMPCRKAALAFGISGTLSAMWPFFFEQRQGEVHPGPVDISGAGRSGSFSIIERDGRLDAGTFDRRMVLSVPARFSDAGLKAD
jgi:hypothetical protein